MKNRPANGPYQVSENDSPFWIVRQNGTYAVQAYMKPDRTVLDGLSEEQAERLQVSLTDLMDNYVRLEGSAPELEPMDKKPRTLNYGALAEFALKHGPVGVVWDSFAVGQLPDEERDAHVLIERDTTKFLFQRNMYSREEFEKVVAKANEPAPAVK